MTGADPDAFWAAPPPDLLRRIGSSREGLSVEEAARRLHDGGPNALVRGRTDLVLLEIDEARLPEPPRWEHGDPTDPETPLFPHIYGPIPVAAVVAVRPYRPGPDGSFAPLA